MRVSNLQKHLEHLGALGALQGILLGAEDGDSHGQQNLCLEPTAPQSRVDGLLPVAGCQALVDPVANVASVLHEEGVGRLTSCQQLREHDAEAEHIRLLRVSADRSPENLIRSSFA